jgi:hypothetical protein
MKIHRTSLGFIFDVTRQRFRKASKRSSCPAVVQSATANRQVRWNQDLNNNSPVPSSYWAGIAQSVKRLAADSKVQGSNPQKIPVGRDFSHPFRPALRLTQSPVQWYLVFYGDKANGAWCWPPTPSSAEVTNEKNEMWHLITFLSSLEKFKIY